MDSRVPVVVLAGLDRLDLDAAAMSVLCDVPRAVLLRVEIDDEAGAVRRVVSDLGGVVDDSATELEHPCLSCAMREVVLPTLVALARSGRWAAVVVQLPAAAEPLPLVVGITRSDVDGDAANRSVRLAEVVAVVSTGDVSGAVFGDDDLHDHDIALSTGDTRSYAEVFLTQVELADTILVADRTATRAEVRLLEHVHRPGTRLLDQRQGLDGRVLVRDEHDAAASRAFVDPRRRTRPPQARDGELVTVAYSSWKPFHPQRMRARMRDLGEGEMYARGAFWLPGRPDTAVAWNAVGGRMSLGSIGDWEGCERGTRWVATCRPDVAGRIGAAFEAALMSDEEMLSTRSMWSDRKDGFERWLGRRDASAA